jgi:energy-coupling factor transporter ATP-binding protein EcfA2
MTRTRNTTTSDLFADPFGERSKMQELPPTDLLGARFVFKSNSSRLLRLAAQAFARLPAHRLSAHAPRLELSLLLTPERRLVRAARLEPPPLQMLSGSGYLIGAPESANFVCLSPAERRGVVTVSETMLRYPYHTRYELLEFAVYTLASRCQGLVSLHAACIARAGRGILLMGESGAGKSTITLHSLLQGFDIIAEDSVFVQPRTLKATGLANFLHITEDSLHWVARARDIAAIRKAPVIQRRSGAKKYEVNLRHGSFRLAASPVTIVAVVFLSAQRGVRGGLLEALSKSDLSDRLSDAQAYAANQPHWSLFERAVARRGAFVLRRGAHPRDSVEALAAIVDSTQSSTG